MNINTITKSISFIFVVSLLMACSPASDETRNNSSGNIEVEEQTNNTNNNQQAVTNDDQSYMEEQLANSYFKEFEVDIKYPNDVDYEFEITRDDGRIEAKLEDDFSNKEINGKEAFDYIFERIEGLSIDHNTSFDSIKEQIIAAFELQDDYTEFEVEIILQDGTKLEYEND